MILTKEIERFDFLKYFTPLSTNIERGYRSIIILTTIFNLVSADKDVLGYINSYPWFWIETINAHKTNVFINLGKIFDIDIKSQSIHFLKSHYLNIFLKQEVSSSKNL